MKITITQQNGRGTIKASRYFIIQLNEKYQVYVIVKQVKRQTTKSEQLAVHNVELVLVVDYAIYRRNDGDMYKILKRVFDIVNVIKQVKLFNYFRFYCVCKIFKMLDLLVSANIGHVSGRRRLVVR